MQDRDTVITFKEAKERLGIKPMTNEEWLRSLNTEQLAEFIATQCADAIRLWRDMQYWTAHEKCKSNKWYVWLKEIHHADRS